MPCKDVTEVFRLVLDKDDRLKEYAFTKRTCGQGIGEESLLIDQLGGRSMTEILSISPEAFLDSYPMDSDIEEFLSLKHLIAIQSALEVLVGAEAGRNHDAFAAAGIVYDEDSTEVQGRIAVDILTERIEACGGCASCDKPEVEEGKRLNRERRAERRWAAASQS